MNNVALKWSQIYKADVWVVVLIASTALWNAFIAAKTYPKVYSFFPLLKARHNPCAVPDAKQ